MSRSSTSPTHHVFPRGNWQFWVVVLDDGCSYKIPVLRWKSRTDTALCPRANHAQSCKIAPGASRRVNEITLKQAPGLFQQTVRPNRSISIEFTALFDSTRTECDGGRFDIGRFDIESNAKKFDSTVMSNSGCRQNSDKSPCALYEPDKTKYVVPTDILSHVGGKSTGGATKAAPADGFSHQDLKVFMTRKASVTVGNVGGVTETSNPDDSKDSGLSTGAIVGIGVSGAAVVVLGLAAAWCLLLLRGRGSTIASQQPMSQSYDYHLAQTSSHFSQGPWSPGSSHFNTARPPLFHSDTPRPSSPTFSRLRRLNCPPREITRRICRHTVSHQAPQNALARSSMCLIRSRSTSSTG
ncbi:hypothetical protein EDB81DRAFT_863097 [Dactylonectria macrodidyma]|uniref:Uncharacterized protein n=1 Tax=Dactylonectria macrodidyma TaxID=307937 RepID=A0A9P9D0I6_9HYPO|nr:hypothetical protein EDB81DRAFT_863097 [Dactylonectria macrodidyma]